MQNPLFYGCGTALVTPFHGSRVDYDALEGLIDWQIDSEADALILLGTTGEAATITESERSAILECAVSRCAGRVPLIAGTGSNDTRAAIRASIEAQRLGADALLVISPYCNRTSREGVIEHYTAIADSVEIPIIIYNVPGRTGMNLDAELIARLARHPLLCGVKEASTSLEQLTDLAACAEGLAIYCGNDAQIVPALSLGARGAISVAANLIPTQMHDMVMHYLRGDVRASLALQIEYLPLIRALFEEVNPIPVKAAMSLLRGTENALRLPLVPLQKEKAQRLKRLMADYGLLKQT